MKLSPGEVILVEMNSSYTIGRLARAAGVPVSTIRYYERIKLLGAEGRTEGNYRLYDAAALERLRFIRAAQAHGFTLHDVGAMLAFQDGRTPICGEIQRLIEDRLGDLDQRVKQLRHLRNVLRSSLAVCRGAGRPADQCGVIDELRFEAGGSRPSPASRSRVRRSRVD